MLERHLCASIHWATLNCVEDPNFLNYLFQSLVPRPPPGQIKEHMAAERVDKTAFYEAVDSLKSQQKTKQSQITFVEDKFYDKAKHYLKSII